MQNKWYRQVELSYMDNWLIGRIEEEFTDAEINKIEDLIKDRMYLEDSENTRLIFTKFTSFNHSLKDRSSIISLMSEMQVNKLEEDWFAVIIDIFPKVDSECFICDGFYGLLKFLTDLLEDKLFSQS